MNQEFLDALIAHINSKKEVGGTAIHLSADDPLDSEIVTALESKGYVVDMFEEEAGKYADLIKKYQITISWN